MAVGTSFKQQCPTCEAMIPIRDSGLIGRKMECPQCKDKFLVKDPKGSNGKAGGKSAKPQKKRFRDEDDEEIDEVEEELDEVEEEAPRVRSNGKAKRRVLEDEEEEDEEEEKEDKKGKKKKKNNAGKMHIGLILAGVGVVGLLVAAFFMIRGGDTKKQPPGAGLMPGPGAGGMDDPDPEALVDGKDKEFDPGAGFRPGAPLSPPDPRVLTNLLPPDTQHVFHAYLKDVFSSALLRTAGLDLPGPFTSPALKQQLGFNPLKVNDLIRAERFAPQHWVFTVVHLAEEVNLPALTDALGLERQERVKGRDYYLAKKSNPAFDRLARASLGVPVELQHLAESGQNRQTYVHIHDRQTLIFADKEPLVEFLTAEGHFPMVSDEEAGPSPKGPPGMGPPGMMPPGASPPGVEPAGLPGDPMMPPGDPMLPGDPMMGPDDMDVPGMPTDPGGTVKSGPAPPAVLRASYRTLDDTNLKKILDRMESVEGGKEKVLFSSVTDLASAAMSPPGPEYRGKVLYWPRLFWDVTLLLDERRPRLQTIGASLVQKDGRKFQYRQELTCLSEEDAKEVRKELKETKSRDIVRFLDRLLAHKVEMPAADRPKSAWPDGMGPDGFPMPGTFPEPGGFPGPVPMPGYEEGPGGMPPYGDPNMGFVKKKDDAAKSRLRLKGTGRVIEFDLDLVLDAPAYRKLETVARMMTASLGAELETVSAALNRHKLAEGARKMAETGSSRGVSLPAGKYPPAAFARPSSPTRVGKFPDEQVSWMAALLPFVGQEPLHRRINLEESWRDPANWMAGRTIVPQFLDPSYPDSARYVSYGDLPIEMGATHYVGIAGVGLDAADYKADDPATVHKRGVFGYRRQLPIEEIKAGRGLSNVGVMIQVPHDSPAGVTPWIAGGGATVRGVPEKNSIAPFVLGKDRTGKDIQHERKRGTYVLMADGSVRFVTEDVSDEVFKAIATLEGPAPKDFDLDANENTPLVRGGKAPRKGPAASDPAVSEPAVKDPPPAKKSFFPFPFPRRKAEPEKKEAAPAPLEEAGAPMSWMRQPRRIPEHEGQKRASAVLTRIEANMLLRCARMHRVLA